MLDNHWVRLANNWAHDVGTGLWAACLVVLLVIGAQRASFETAAPDAYLLIAQVTSTIFELLVIALVVITLTGAVRLFYWRSQTPPDQLSSKRPALIFKHVAFVLIYAPGTWWAWTLVWPAG